MTEVQRKMKEMKIEADARRLNKQFWFEIKEHKYGLNVPQAREGASLVHHPYTNKFYIFGGVLNDP